MWGGVATGVDEVEKGVYVKKEKKRGRGGGGGGGGGGVSIYGARMPTVAGGG